ncbi:MAG: gluconokinase [Pseudomonadota bacterium]
MTRAARSIVLMGVSGCGKTTVGSALAARLELPFHDADDFHPTSSIDKMAAGEPLTDADRAPWLDRLAALISEEGPVVLACSALRRTYRETLRAGNRVEFVHLVVDAETVRARISAREHHYMPAALVESQFATLETPQRALRVDGTEPLEPLVNRLAERFGARES